MHIFARCEMEVTLYGKEDNDPTLLQRVRDYAEAQGCKRLTVAMWQRKEPSGRPCGFPGSVTYEFIMDGGRPKTARQFKNGEVVCPVTK